MLNGNPIHRLFHLLVEVVDPEFVEVAQEGIPRPVGNQIDPVVEKLVIVAAQILAAAFHFQHEARFPDEIGEPCGPAVLGDSEEKCGRVKKWQGGKMKLRWWPAVCSSWKGSSRR